MPFRMSLVAHFQSARQVPFRFILFRFRQNVLRVFLSDFCADFAAESGSDLGAAAGNLAHDGGQEVQYLLQRRRKGNRLFCCSRTHDSRELGHLGIHMGRKRESKSKSHGLSIIRIAKGRVADETRASRKLPAISCCGGVTSRKRLPPPRASIQQMRQQPPERASRGKRAGLHGKWHATW